MRRFLSWQLPLIAGLLAAAVFAWGFVLGARGGVGAVVLEIPELKPAEESAEDRLSILILGDSLARGSGDPSGLGIGGSIEEELKRREITHEPVINIGVDGATAEELLDQIESPSVRLLIQKADLVVVSIGGNDLWRDDGPGGILVAPDNPDELLATVLEKVKDSVAAIRTVSPSGRIFWVGLYNPFAGEPEGKALNPLVNRWNANLRLAFESDMNFTVVQTEDLFTHADRLSADRFHPGEDAYRAIGRRIADAVGDGNE